jgi:hypothetical protein
MEVECNYTTQTGAVARSGKAIFVGALASWLVLSTSTVTVLTWPNPRVRATLGMGWGLILLWIGVCGILMYRFREPIRAAVLRLRLGWRTKFILMATVLALIEEAITTTMTNQWSVPKSCNRTCKLQQQRGQRVRQEQVRR